MENNITVERRNCGYTTDMNILSDTNPDYCPDCWETLYLEGTEIKWADYNANPEKYE